MSFATIRSLQRDYGLPFVAAANLIHEQTALARKHYRVWFVLGGIGLAVMIAGAFLLSRPFANPVFNIVWACACLCTGIGELLSRRRAQACIVALARGPAAGSGPGG